MWKKQLENHNADPSCLGEILQLKQRLTYLLKISSYRQNRVSEHGTLRSHEARMADHEVSSIRLTNSKICTGPEITYHNTRRVTPGTQYEQNRRAEASCKSSYPSHCIISHRGIAPDLASTCVHTEGIDPYNQLLERKTLELG